MKKLYFSILLVSLFLVNGFGQQFNVSYPPSLYDKAFTGNVIVYLSKESKEPKDAFIGFDLIPCFSVFVKNVQPGQVVIIDDKAISYPTTLSNIERGAYYVQVVWDRNLGGRSIAASEGNLYNLTQKINLTKDTKKILRIAATQLIPPVPNFDESEFVKELKAPSSLLSRFHGKPMTVDGAVILPKEYYEEPTRTFPVVFEIFGFGGDYHRLSGETSPNKPLDSIPVIMVFLDGNCSLGHCVYANSDNNGPWGDALTTEFIPALEKNYRCNGARLLTGHSSGGWTALWLQTHYPKVFDGCWASSPDPVDFHSFSKVNLYEDKNIFYDKDSSLRLIASVGGDFPWATMKNIYQMENVVVRGEQMHSFNAVFSKKGADGLPERICNSTTGVIDPTVFLNWKKYDIALYLNDNWEAIKSQLDGKVRISVGNDDNFQLNYAVKLLETQMFKLNSKFQFAYYPGDHFTIWTADYGKDGNRFLKQRYVDWIAKSNIGKK